MVRVRIVILIISHGTGITTGIEVVDGRLVQVPVGTDIHRGLVIAAEHALELVVHGLIPVNCTIDEHVIIKLHGSYPVSRNLGQ